VELIVVDVACVGSSTVCL